MLFASDVEKSVVSDINFTRPTQCVFRYEMGFIWCRLLTFLYEGCVSSFRPLFFASPHEDRTIWNATGFVADVRLSTRSVICVFRWFFLRGAFLCSWLILRIDRRRTMLCACDIERWLDLATARRGWIQIRGGRVSPVGVTMRFFSIWLGDLYSEHFHNCFVYGSFLCAWSILFVGRWIPLIGSFDVETSVVFI